MELENTHTERQRERERERVNGRGRGCGQQNVFGGRCRGRALWGRVMSVEARELTEWGIVWEGTSGAAEWGMCRSRVEEEGSAAALGKVLRPVI